jgi:lipid-binding SYLF domain-containing protein
LQPASSNGSKSEKKLVRIPPEILQKAVGLAIFTTLRVGLGLGESTGSGIVIARLHDGSWSPPSAIQLQSFGAGVAAGVDLFDCVCVINTQEALSAFMNTRFSLGAGVAQPCHRHLGVGQRADRSDQGDVGLHRGQAISMVHQWL